jgi:hypothetical protein
MPSKLAQSLLDELENKGHLPDGTDVKTIFEKLNVSKGEFEAACQELVNEQRVFWTQHKSRDTFPLGSIKLATGSDSSGRRIEYQSAQDRLDDMSDEKLGGYIRELIDHLQKSEGDMFTAGNQIKEIGRILKLLSDRIDRIEKRQ